MAPGGTGDARAAAADDQAVADAVRADVEKQAGAAFDVYEAKVVKTQVSFVRRCIALDISTRIFSQGK